ncbi:deoxynucleoside kinase [Candidatus Aenigmatarchaeota archaeon]
MKDKVFISIAGNIGSGKTTVAKLISSIFRYEMYKERVDENPYIHLFYQDMKTWSYRVQRFFLLTRVIAHEKINMSDISCVQDRSIYEDVEIFAKNQMKTALWTPSEYERYTKFCELILEELKPPDLMIFLKTSVPVLRKRIRERNRKYEEQLMRDDDPYLHQIQEMYDNWIKNFIICPKLIIDTDNLNFVKNPDDVKKLVSTIKSALRRKEMKLNEFAGDKGL